MTNVIAKEITAKLETLFADLDAEVLSATKEWAKGRCAAIKEFKDSKEFRNDNGFITDQYKYYARLFAIAGGKTWYNILGTHYGDRQEEFIIKNCKVTAEKRNASIVRKMIKAGVTEVTGQEYARSKDGFNGFFIINTNEGTKRVSIDTIRAGGYNIQCLHLRVLVKVK